MPARPAYRRLLRAQAPVNRPPHDAVPHRRPAGRGAAPPAAGVWRWLPGLHTLVHYQRAWLKHDLAAGLALTAVLVPVGMAYASASGAPAIAGLYATVLALLAYALFGPSRLLVLGPDSSLVALVLGVVLSLSGGDPARALALAAAIALVSGLLCLLAGLAKLGFITELLSKPIRYGYMNGIAITVLISQAPALLGLQVERSDQLLGTLWAAGAELLAGRVHLPTVLLGGAVVACIVVLRRVPRLPGVLVAVVGATLAVTLLDLSTRHGVEVLGAVPQGLPLPMLPMLTWQDLLPVLLAGLAVALVSFADTSVLSRSYAARTRTPVNPNQEMVALGAANLAAGLFQGVPVSASSSRTPVAEAAGARSQAAGLVGALAVAALLAFGTGLLADLPRVALAAVVVVAALTLIELRGLRRIHRMQPWEFWLSLGCTAGVVVLGPIEGIGLAVLLAVIEFLWGSWRPHSAVLGKADGVEGYHDVQRYPAARREPGLVLFRWDAPLFFANAEFFRERVLQAVAASPTPARQVVVGAEPITSVDVTAADVLAELDAELQAQGVVLVFAEMKDPTKDKLKHFGLFAALGEHRFFATLEEAVAGFAANGGAPPPDCG